MSKMRKIASLLLAVVMVLSLTCTAFAADTEQYTITINNDTSGYTYVAYQIFAGDLSTETDAETQETTTVLSNIVFGSALSEDDQTTVLTYYNVDSAAALAEALANKTISAADFAEYIASFTLTSAGSSTYSETNKNYTITVTGAGYYLIKNTIVPATDSAYSDYILEVIKDTSVDPKADDVPQFDKTVDGETTDDATAQYAVGDSVPFTLTATLPQGYSAYTTYKLVFTDTLSSGLSFNNDVSVTIDGITIPAANYTVSDVTENEDGTTTFTVTFSDLKSIEIDGLTIGADSKVVVSYSARLTEDAQSTENNKALLTFSNNPNDSSSTSSTPEDKTYVVTFDVTVKKVDGDNNPLEGAGFTLYKYDEETKEYVVVKVLSAADEDGTSFSIDGLAVGTYKLVETTTPAGYNTADDIIFTITADPTETETGVDVNGSVNNSDLTLTSTSLATTVVNEQGSSLPSTGGIGTTIFYIVGTILVLGAAVLLITRRRMSKAD